MKRVAAVIAAVFVAGTLVLADEQVDTAVVAKIKEEGFQHSQVMDTLSWLSDVYGPRLTASRQLEKAAQWARDQLTRWGLEHAALENYGDIGRGWDLERFDIQMTEPSWMRITGYPRAWSPATPEPIVGTPVLVTGRTVADLTKKYHGKLRGAIVMDGRTDDLDIGFSPEATRYTDQQLEKKEAAIDPAPEVRRGNQVIAMPKNFWDEEKEFDDYLKQAIDRWKFFADEGVAALVSPSPIREDVRVDGFYDKQWHATYPAFVISREHYGRVMRMLDRHAPVKLSLSVSATFTDHVQGFNVVAEIPGSDKASEIVMLGGHFDSWHSATGATDNGAGSAVAMEAVRILKAIGVKPRRTIRVALWTGEEQDYFGSLGYAEKHFGDAATMALKPEHEKLAAYFNLDNGAGRIRGVNLQGNEAVRPIFEAWLKPFNYIGATTLTTLNTGGTDHMVFDALGLPGFQFIQDPLNYETRTHHSNLDVYEEAPPEDLKEDAVIMASFVYDAAMRDQMLPRKPLPKPHTPEKTQEPR